MSRGTRKARSRPITRSKHSYGTEKDTSTSGLQKKDENGDGPEADKTSTELWQTLDDSHTRCCGEGESLPLNTCGTCRSRHALSLNR